MTAPTLNEVLRTLSLTTKPAGHGCKDITDGTTTLLANARAGEVWAWLRDTGRIT